ncbi:MAG: response regulator transcription factor [Atopobiaceae bacterium]
MAESIPWEKVNQVLVQCEGVHAPREFCIAAANAVRQIVPYDAATVFFMAEDGRLVDEHLIGITRSLAREYIECYQHADAGRYSVERYAREYLLRMTHTAIDPTAPVVLDWAQEPHTTQFWREYMSRRRVRWAIGFTLTDLSGKIRAIIALDRTEDMPAPTATELATLSATIRHLDALYRNFYVTPPAERKQGIAALLSGDARGVAKDDSQSLAACLTPREKAVGWLLVQGKSPKAAADALGISRATVYKHIEHMHRKLGASNQPELIHVLTQIFTGTDQQNG